MRVQGFCSNFIKLRRKEYDMGNIINDGKMHLGELENLLELSECATFILEQGAEFKLVYANKKLYDILQYTKKELHEKFDNRLMEVILPEEKQKIRNLIARQSAAGGHIHLEYRIQRKDGAVRFLSMTARTIMQENRMFYYCSCLDVTQQKRALAEVYDAKREVDLITNNIPGGVIKLKVSDFSILYSNDGFYRLAGYSRSEYFSLFGNHCDNVIYPPDQKKVSQLVQSAVDNSGTISFEYRIVAKNGDIRWSYVNGCRVDDQDGDIVYLCIIMDITARKKLEEEVADNLQRSGYLLDYMRETEWTYIISKAKLYRNGYIEGTYSRETEIADAFTKDALSLRVHPDDLEAFCDIFDERVREIGSCRGVFKVKDASGNYHPSEINLISVSSCGGDVPDKIYGETRLLDDHSFMIMREPNSNVDKEHAASKILEIAKTARAKSEDAITGMITYDDWIKRAQEMLAKSEHDKYGILCCDIDGFQRLTYHYGISIGNEVLLRFAKLLCEHMAYDKMCSRVSGDYFVVFFCYKEHGELLKRVSHMLRVQTENEKDLSYNTYGTTSGIYLVGAGEQDLEKMLEKADLARRSIKGTKGNHYSIYTEDLQKNQFVEEEVLDEIGTAMMNQAIEICYLPRIRGKKENVIGCKAVPQIQLNNGSYLSLEDLRRYVDRSKEIQQLVFYVLSNVCCNQGAWKARGMNIMPISIDITASQLCLQNAVNKIDEIVCQNNLEPDDIIFEMQEHCFKELTTTLQMAIEDLHHRGYKVYISRFGSDHTAIHSLRNLPVAGIKFHGEYFKQDISDKKEFIILQKIIEMVKDMGLSVSCGGIHTKLQENIARSIGCDILEGEIYYGAVRNDVYEKCFLKE